MKTDKKIEKELEDKVYWILEELVKQPEDVTSITTTNYAKRILEMVDDELIKENYTPNTEVQKAREEAVRGFWNHFFEEIAMYERDNAGLPSPFFEFSLGLGGIPSQTKRIENELREALKKYFARKYETYLQSLYKGDRE